MELKQLSKEYIHEIANHVTIADGLLRKTIKTLSKKDDQDLQSDIEVLEKVLKYIKKISESTEKHRSDINKF